MYLYQYMTRGGKRRPSRLGGPNRKQIQPTSYQSSPKRYEIFWIHLFYVWNPITHEILDQSSCLIHQINTTFHRKNYEIAYIDENNQ